MNTHKNQTQTTKTSKQPKQPVVRLRLGIRDAKGGYGFTQPREFRDLMSAFTAAQTEAGKYAHKGLREVVLAVHL